ncbi:hypothetical protein DSLASN_13050 [Desulfoluna limicola]|uniref:Outer membrane protein beta-barrel domain-containing protein n=1 Tax=Desulfoluna limicola TaxID=2810562 RepID=A0ABN6F167_9BACT|nr:hypothetical protein [Desulfoluna limicola]BCS95673.1 hypothetical protein DSLASN_13050 [Desulfoluna limicola]
MKRFVTAFLLLTVCLCGNTYAEEREGFGVGVILGEPTGVSLKKWMGNTNAIDAGIAWSFSGDNSFHLHGDYLVHNFELVSVAEAPGQLPVYFGIGGRVKFDDKDDNTFGVRVPIGIAYMPAGAPIDFFGEIVPVLDLIPDSDFDMNAAIGARFYF